MNNNDERGPIKNESACNYDEEQYNAHILDGKEKGHAHTEREWAETLPYEVFIDLRAVTHFALHGAGFLKEDHHEDDSGMKEALKRIESEITVESMRRWKKDSHEQ